MGMLDPAALKKLPVIRWIESTSVDRALIVTGKALVYVGIVAGLYVLWIMSTPRAGFFGIGARGADVTFAGLLASGVVVLYHVALGFICQGDRPGDSAARLHGSTANSDRRPAGTVSLIESSLQKSNFHREARHSPETTEPIRPVPRASPLDREGIAPRPIQWSTGWICRGLSSRLRSIPGGFGQTPVCVPPVVALPSHTPGTLRIVCVVRLDPRPSAVVRCRDSAPGDRRASRGQLSGLPLAGRRMNRLTGPSPLLTPAV